VRQRELTVSVIVPTRDYGRFLGQAIGSLQLQSYPDWECVVVDDGSSDGTAGIVAALAASDHRISYLSQSAAGPAAARNAGLAATSGDFVQFLDADDFLGSRKLLHQLELFASHPDADIVYGGVRYFIEGRQGGDEEPFDRRWTGAPTRPVVSGTGQAVMAALVNDNIMVIEAPLVRRSLLEKTGGFDPRFRRMEDWDLWLRCAQAGAYFLHDGAYEDDELTHVRIHPSSSSQDLIAMHQAAVQVRMKMQGDLPTEDLRRMNLRRMYEQLAIVGRLEGLYGRLRLGVRYLLRAGLAERNVRWLAWAILLPLVRRPPGSWALRRVHSILARRRGEEVRDWQTHWP
jgi:glycosyltransferase involved in cell wall biosynthesis